MKTFPKAVFLMLAATAASASADTTLWQKIYGEHEQQLENANADEGQDVHLHDVIHALTIEAANTMITSGDDSDDDDEGDDYYDEDDYYYDDDGSMSMSLDEYEDEDGVLLSAEKKDDDKDKGKKDKDKGKKDKGKKDKDKKDKDKKDKDKKDKDKKDKDKKDKDKDKKDKDKKTKTPKEKPTKKPTNKNTPTKPTKSPTRAKTDKPTRSKTDKPTRKPTKDTRRPTRKPTRKPTKKPSSDRCGSVDKKKPKSKRSGESYRFKLEKSDARCLDKDKNRYEYGQFDKVKKFSDCADKCVKDVSSSVLDNFRGYEWNCKNRECRCLYDEGTLDSRTSDRYDRSNRNNDGEGPIKKTEKKKDRYCAKLDSVKFVGMIEDNWGDEDEEEVEVEVTRALRGGAN